MEKLSKAERFQALSAVARLREKVNASKTQSFVDAFAKMDTDESGALSYDEFGEVLKYWEPRLSERAVHAICSLLDVNGDKEIELREFAQAREARGGAR